MKGKSWTRSDATEQFHHIGRNSVYSLNENISKRIRMQYLLNIKTM